MDVIFFKIALFASLASSLCYVVSILVKRVVAAKIATWILLAVFLFLTVSFGFRCVTTGSSELLTSHGILAFFAWAMSGGYLALQIKTKTRVLGVLVAPLVSLILIGASIGIGVRVELPVILRGSLVPLHVLLTLTGEALLIIASVAGGMYLVQNRAIKKKRMGGLVRLLPSLTDLDRINHLSLLAGFPLLTLGVLLGSLLLSAVLGSHWQWDPKFIWASIVWFFYGILIYQRLFLGWKGHRPALYSSTAFSLLLASYLAVRFFLPTVHRFI